MDGAGSGPHGRRSICAAYECGRISSAALPSPAEFPGATVFEAEMRTACC